LSIESAWYNFKTSSAFQYSYNLARCDISWRRHKYRRSIKIIILYTAEKFPRSPADEKIDEYFGMKSHVGFEPNFHHKIELKKLENISKKFRVKLFTETSVFVLVSEARNISLPTTSWSAFNWTLYKFILIVQVLDYTFNFW
jgi:hypothetical protein